MKALAVALVLALSGPAIAQPRLSTLAMSCAQARSTVATHGGIVLGTGPSTYGRFVSGPGACLRGEITEPGYAPTADNPQCFVGYRCRDTDLDNGR